MLGVLLAARYAVEKEKGERLKEPGKRGEPLDGMAIGVASVRARHFESHFVIEKGRWIIG
jgi:hypothetical protein